MSDHIRLSSIQSGPFERQKSTLQFTQSILKFRSRCGLLPRHQLPCCAFYPKYWWRWGCLLVSRRSAQWDTSMERHFFGQHTALNDFAEPYRIKVEKKMSESLDPPCYNDATKYCRSFLINIHNSLCIWPPVNSCYESFRNVSFGWREISDQITSKND